MKRFLVFFLSFLSFLLANSQNLVLNPSFEFLTDCPDDQYEIDLAEPWTSFSNTPDLFNACDETGIASVPNSEIYGYQAPLTGNGQAGFIALGFSNTHEIIGAPLNSPLTIGEDYYVSFYVNRGFGGGFHSNCDCAINNIGLKFTNTAYSVSESIPIENEADILFEEVITDTVGWTHISGWYTADQEYTHIAIGNFFDPENSIIENYNGYDFYKTYYFVDEVCISKNQNDCILPLNNTTSFQAVNFEPIISPNPSPKSIRISYFDAIKNIEIVRLDGKVILRKTYGQLGLKEVEIDISSLDSGLYQLKLESVSGLMKISKFIKTN